MALLLVLALVSPGCAGLQTPVDGPIVEAFAPLGRYAGHWGVDFAVPIGTPVGAAAPGTVTFVGVVVGNRTVTIDHGGLKTSYSYLVSASTRRGRVVRTGDVIGRSGYHGERPSLHLSVRVDGVYVDPEPVLTCDLVPGPGLWLRSAGPAYPVGDAGHHGRYLRPTTRGTPRRR